MATAAAPSEVAAFLLPVPGRLLRATVARGAKVLQVPWRHRQRRGPSPLDRDAWLAEGPVAGVYWLAALDDGYEPDRCKANTEKLIRDDAFAPLGRSTAATCRIRMISPSSFISCTSAVPATGVATPINCSG